MIGTPLEINAVEPGDIIPWDCPHCAHENELEISADVDTLFEILPIECVACEGFSEIHTDITLRLDLINVTVNGGDGF